MTDAIGRSQFDDFLAGVSARSIDWEAPPGAPADLDMVEVLFGKGDKPLEVAVATSSLTPKADDIRKLWNTRANRGAPVLLVVLHRDGTSGELRASVIGTEGDPAPLIGLSAGRVERIASIALDEPDRNQAVRVLDRLDEIIHDSSVDATELGAETGFDVAYHPELAVLVVASLVTRLWHLFVPNAVVFDEIHFKTFAGHYFDGAYFYDIHPPLGKLLLAAYARLIGLAPSDMLTGTAVGMRVLPAVCGALLVPLVWGILRRFGVSRPLAFLGAFLVLADNALLVESRFILMDSMLMLFGLGAVYFYLIARSVEGRGRWVWWSLAVLSGGAAASIKWTGLTALALVAATWVWDRRHHLKKEWRRLLGEAAILVLVPAVLYGGAFWLHFQLLPRTGQGDPFMTQAFQSTLIGNPNYDPRARMSFVQEFLELNAEMLRANQTLTATHPYSSAWYSWPFEQRGVYFWMGKALPDGTRGDIYLLGNPAIWWGVVPAIMIGLGALFMMYRKVPGTGRYALVLTAVAYAMNLVPFTGVTRVLFLYHYFFSFVYSLMFAIILWDLILRHSLAKPPSSRTVLIAVGTVAAVVLAAWVYFLPLSYGTPLPRAALETRMWLTTWR